MGGLIGILSLFNLRECRICCYQNKRQERDDALILQMPRKTHLSSASRNPSCCRLCGLVKKANEELYAEAAMEDLASLPRMETMSTALVL